MKGGGRKKFVRKRLKKVKEFCEKERNVSRETFPVEY